MKSTLSGWYRQNPVGGTHEVECRFIGAIDLDEFSAIRGRRYFIEIPERVLLAHFYFLKPALIEMPVNLATCKRYPIKSVD